MPTQMKVPTGRLAVCTGGGDCPGLNALIRAVVLVAERNHGIEVMGVRNGLTGLSQERTSASHASAVVRLTTEHVADILDRGGTILGTNNRGSPFRDPSKAPEVIAATKRGFAEHKLDALIVIGGDGTQNMAGHLVAAGLPIIGIPKTIDNDVMGNDTAVGFATAVDVATTAACSLRNSAAAHDRIMILEVMGREAGHIALAAGIAAGADAILIPEIPFTYESLAADFAARTQRGGRSWLVVAAEGARAHGSEPKFRPTPDGGGPVLGGIAEEVAQALHAASRADVRVTVLGHLQRGAPPNAADRMLAAQLAHHAVLLVRQKKLANSSSSGTGDSRR